MACFGLYFQVIIFDQFLLLLLDMFISIVFKNTESDLDFKALYGIITLPKWYDLATEKIVALKGQFSITKEMYLKDLIMSRTRTLC